MGPEWNFRKLVSPPLGGTGVMYDIL